MLLLGAFWYVVSFAFSVFLYPLIYKHDSSAFSKLRGGPAIGTALAFLSSYSSLELLRVRGKGGSEGNLFSLMFGFVAVGAGVITADLWRSVRGEV